MSDETLATNVFHRVRRKGETFLGRDRLWLLVVPMTLFFVVFFVFPVLSLLADSFDKPLAGRVARRLQPGSNGLRTHGTPQWRAARSKGASTRGNA